MQSNINLDDGVDAQIMECLNLDDPKSFFLYAGAGSGKTRSLVNVLDALRHVQRNRLVVRGQKIAVITYTNAACDEIKHRLEFDPLVHVSTIHSFSWDLINGFDSDIREWLRQNLTKEIAELSQIRGRPGSAANEVRAKTIDSKTRRIARLNDVKKFNYSPNGENTGRDSLNHSEVIAITAGFLSEHKTLRSILVERFPVLFIDESQDTNKHLMDAFLKVQADASDRFCLGLFGDLMQRIYSDGKPHLDRSIPDSWATPIKQLNHRCPNRVVRLINQIRYDVDKIQQTARTDRPEGHVHLFIAPLNSSKSAIEDTVTSRMAEISGNSEWTNSLRPPKSLILEHHMAASRLGFGEMYAALASAKRLRTGLGDGSLAAVRFFSADVYPLIESSRGNDAFAIASVLRNSSPLLSPEALAGAGDDHREQLKKASGAVKGLINLWESPIVTFQKVLNYVAKYGLFLVPESLAAFVQTEKSLNENPAISDRAGSSDEIVENEEFTEELDAIKNFLQTPFDQISQYSKYVSGLTHFDTHQGVKGLEFPRVVVIISDEEARGFLFSYDKLFGTKIKSKTDIDNESAGVETSVDRTRRLFYVTCSRATESLAIIAYSGEPMTLQKQVIDRKWFAADEVEIVDF